MSRNQLIAGLCCLALFAPGAALSQTTKPRPIPETPEQTKQRLAIDKKFAECLMKAEAANLKHGTYQFSNHMKSCMGSK